MSIRDIIAEVADKHGLTPDDITGRSRVHKIIHARHEVMWTARQVKLADGRPRYSFPMIGRLMKRDHSTIVNGVTRHAQRLANPPPPKRKRRRRSGPLTPCGAALRREQEAAFAERLRWRYGPERAASILAGTDPATNADIAKWNALGQPSEKRVAGL